MVRHDNRDSNPIEPSHMPHSLTLTSFRNFGLSADRVDKYYEPVVQMEELAKDSIEEDDEMAKRMVKMGGFLLLVGAVVLRRGA